MITGFRKNRQTDEVTLISVRQFDSVSHPILARKLDLLGFPVDLFRWILSYLNGRTQKVILKNSFSSLIRVMSGVPQGSHLGPLLFTLFINDLPLALTKSRVLMYADDVELCLQYNDPAKSLALQSDLNAFQKWCMDNELNFNDSKCKLFFFFF